MKQNNTMDERQKQINMKAAALGGAFLALCIIISMICKMITTEDIGWEFWALLDTCLVILISRNLLGDIEQPTDINNRPLPVGSSKADKRARKKDYTLRSLIFGAVCAVMDVLLVATGRDDVTDMEVAEILFPGLGKPATIAVTVVIAFTSMFLISFLFDYLIGEKFKVKRYNKMLAELEEE